MAWNDERVELLKRLWAEGLSASQIASRLGGVTRNAVIGKVHRLGLSGRATSSRSSSPRPRRVQAPRQHRAPSLMFGTRGNVALKPVYEEEIEPAPAPIEELYIPPAERATILTLKEAMCRWPIGDPQESEFHFCGKRKVVGLPYCEFHARRAFQPPHELLLAQFLRIADRIQRGQLQRAQDGRIGGKYWSNSMPPPLFGKGGLGGGFLRQIFECLARWRM